MFSFLSFLNPMQWLVAGLGLVALVTGLVLWDNHRLNAREELGYQRGRQEGIVAIEKVQAQAAVKLATETAKVNALEGKLTAALAEQNLKDAENAKIVAAKNAELVRMSRAGSGPGLRDPNAIDCRRGGDSTETKTATAASSSPDDGSQTGGLLSRQLEDLLLKLTSEADTINGAYASCRADAIRIRALSAEGVP